ncbi:mucin-4 isoform X6 [Hydra vulgaris]|uniref:Mucin-4 isoform X6 n=1 Tax=Hydra vulgaris TaxID=6087 RepID=A0ABM4CNB1_HYDVU
MFTKSMWIVALLVIAYSFKLNKGASDGDRHLNAKVINFLKSSSYIEKRFRRQLLLKVVGKGSITLEGECHPSVPLVSCEINYCDFASCPNFPNAECHLNLCGKCEPVYYVNGRKINCYDFQTTYPLLLNSSKNDDHSSPCFKERKQVIQGNKVNEFIVDCEPNGSYKPIQCWPSVGVCWCVNSNGEELFGTRSYFPHRPSCENLVEDCRSKEFGCCPDNKTAAQGLNYEGCSSSTSKCEQLRSMPKFFNFSFRPQCDDNGYFNSVQCWDALNQCWCVNKDGLEIKGSRVNGKKPDCSEVICEDKRNDCQKFAIVPEFCLRLNHFAKEYCRKSCGYCPETIPTQISPTHLTELVADVKEYQSFCEMPPASGPCTSGIIKYFYNPVKMVCEPFFYGGCGGNENNFDNVTMCLRVCDKNAMLNEKKPVVSTTSTPTYQATTDQLSSPAKISTYKLTASPFNFDITDDNGATSRATFTDQVLIDQTSSPDHTLYKDQTLLTISSQESLPTFKVISEKTSNVPSSTYHTYTDQTSNDEMSPTHTPTDLESMNTDQISYYQASTDQAYHNHTYTHQIYESKQEYATENYLETLTSSMSTLDDATYQSQSTESVVISTTNITTSYLISKPDDINLLESLDLNLNECKVRTLIVQRLNSIQEFVKSNTPNCTSDGNFADIQCEKNGYCWCVDQDGNEIAETRLITKPKCPRFKICKDTEEKRKCSEYNNRKYCKVYKNFMKERCPKTCGFCSEHAKRPGCESKFGCCDDGITPKRADERKCPVYKSICDMPVNNGSCNNKFQRFYYDHGHKECKNFFYSGCHGNMNNFLSKEECILRCWSHISSLTLSLTTFKELIITPSNKSSDIYHQTDNNPLTFEPSTSADQDVSKFLPNTADILNENMGSSLLLPTSLIVTTTSLISPLTLELTVSTGHDEFSSLPSTGNILNENNGSTLLLPLEINDSQDTYTDTVASVVASTNADALPLTLKSTVASLVVAANTALTPVTFEPTASTGHDEFSFLAKTANILNKNNGSTLLLPLEISVSQGSNTDTVASLVASTNSDGSPITLESTASTDRDEFSSLPSAANILNENNGSTSYLPLEISVSQVFNTDIVASLVASTNSDGSPITLESTASTDRDEFSSLPSTANILNENNGSTSYLPLEISVSQDSNTDTVASLVASTNADALLLTLKSTVSTDKDEFSSLPSTVNILNENNESVVLTTNTDASPLTLESIVSTDQNEFSSLRITANILNENNGSTLLLPLKISVSQDTNTDTVASLVASTNSDTLPLTLESTASTDHDEFSSLPSTVNILNENNGSTLHLPLDISVSQDSNTDTVASLVTSTNSDTSPLTLESTVASLVVAANTALSPVTFEPTASTGHDEFSFLAKTANILNKNNESTLLLPLKISVSQDTNTDTVASLAASTNSDTSPLTLESTVSTDHDEFSSLPSTVNILNENNGSTLHLPLDISVSQDSNTDTVVSLVTSTNSDTSPSTLESTASTDRDEFSSLPSTAKILNENNGSTLFLPLEIRVSQDSNTGTVASLVASTNTDLSTVTFEPTASTGHDEFSSLPSTANILNKNNGSTLLLPLEINASQDSNTDTVASLVAITNTDASPLTLKSTVSTDQDEFSSLPSTANILNENNGSTLLLPLDISVTQDSNTGTVASLVASTNSDTSPLTLESTASSDHDEFSSLPSTVNILNENNQSTLLLPLKISVSQDTNTDTVASLVASTNSDTSPLTLESTASSDHDEFSSLPSTVNILNENNQSTLLLPLKISVSQDSNIDTIASFIVTTNTDSSPVTLEPTASTDQYMSTILLRNSDLSKTELLVPFTAVYSSIYFNKVFTNILTDLNSSLSPEISSNMDLPFSSYEPTASTYQYVSTALLRSHHISSENTDIFLPRKISISQASIGEDVSTVLTASIDSQRGFNKSSVPLTTGVMGFQDSLFNATISASSSTFEISTKI